MTDDTQQPYDDVLEPPADGGTDNAAIPTDDPADAAALTKVGDEGILGLARAFEAPQPARKQRARQPRRDAVRAPPRRSIRGCGSR